MCFSASASFTASIGLSLVGIIGLTQIKSRKQIPLAAVPFIFAFQQFIEGLLWINLQSEGSKSMSQLLGYIFMVVVGIVWPVFAPACFLPFADGTKAKRWLWALLCAATLGAIERVYFFYTTPLEPEIVNCHINYYPVPLTGFLMYAFVVLSPAFLIKMKNNIYPKIFGCAGLVLLFVAYGISEVCATSIWCFFGAVISVLALFTLRNT